MRNFDEINELIANEEFETAKQKLLRLMAEDGEDIDIEASKLLGLVNVNLEQYEEALKNFEIVVEVNEDDATSWFYLANCYNKTQNVDNAIKAYKRVIALRKNYMEAYKSLCILYMQVQKPKLAIELATKAEEIDPEDYTFVYLIGTAYVAQKKYEEAITFLEQAHSMNPKHSQILCNLATAHFLNNNTEKALELFNRLLEKETENTEALYNVGNIYQTQNKHNEACEYFRKAYELSKDERYLVSLTLSEMKSEQFQSAIEHYTTLIIAHPEKDSYQYNLAVCYEQIKDYKSAIQIMEKLIARNPKSVSMAQKLATMYMDIKELRKAKELYDKIIIKQSPNANSLYQYAIISSQLYDTDTAERIFKKVLKMNPENAQAHKDLGVIYLNKRLFDYAEDEFKTALKLAPENYEIVFEYANFLYSVAKYKEADEYYNKARAINDDVIARTLQAMNKIELKELDKAKELIDSALKDYPEHEYIQFMAGRIYFSLKCYDDAKRFLIHSIEQNPDIETQNLLALTYMGLEEYGSANNIFENLLTKSPDNIPLLYNSASCYEKLDLPDRALEKLYKLTDIFPEHEEAQEMIRRLS